MAQVPHRTGESFLKTRSHMSVIRLPLGAAMAGIQREREREGGREAEERGNRTKAWKGLRRALRQR